MKQAYDQVKEQL